jgi:hypothetical protein
MRTRTILPLLVVSTVGALFIFGGSCMSSHAEDVQRQPVQIILLGPIGDIRGVEVPQAVPDGGQPFFQVQDPSVIEVTLPDGDKKSLSVKTAIVNTSHGTVLDIDLLPLMKSMPFRQAIKELHRCLAEMGITPDEAMKEKMAREWPDDAPGFQPGIFPHTYRARARFSEDSSLYVKVRPANDGGWFLVLTLEATGPKRQAIYDRARAATQPGQSKGQSKGDIPNAVHFSRKSAP